MKSVLVVDDDFAMRLVVKRFLEKEGYSVKEARDGAEAIGFLKVSAYDLVITDLIMPVKTGFELIHELKTLRPGSKVIAFSGGGVVGAKACLEIARRDGAARIFAKPFDIVDLVDAVKELV
jgi:CheY-like chemotaxis protein